MANTPQENKNNTESKPPKAISDLILLIVITIAVLVFSYLFDIFSVIVKFIQKYPDKIIYVDEVIMGLLTISTGLAIFAWRRWRELKEETAKRIKLQEELIRIADTKAETEQIISKQLHSEIEQRKRMELTKSLKIKK